MLFGGVAPSLKSLTYQARQLLPPVSPEIADGTWWQAPIATVDPDPALSLDPSAILKAYPEAQRAQVEEEALTIQLARAPE